MIFVTHTLVSRNGCHAPGPAAANSAGNVVKDYVNALLAICPLYGIPVVDEYDKSGANSINVETVTFDGFLHPAAIGYTNFYNPLIVGEIVKY